MVSHHFFLWPWSVTKPEVLTVYANFNAKERNLLAILFRLLLVIQLFRTRSDVFISSFWGIIKYSELAPMLQLDVMTMLMFMLWCHSKRCFIPLETKEYNRYRSHNRKKGIREGVPLDENRIKYLCLSMMLMCTEPLLSYASILHRLTCRLRSDVFNVFDLLSFC